MPTRHPLKRTVAAFTLLLCCLGTAQHVRAASDIPALTAELDALQKKSALPGFAVAVVTGKEVFYQHGFGLADLRSKAPYTVDTLQNVGSISKTVVGVALVKAIELGYFTLDSEINTILPFQVVNPHGGAPIKVRDLVTHTSGIVDDDELYSHSYYVTAHADKKSPLYASFKRNFTLGKGGDLSLGTFLRNYFARDGRYYKDSNFSKAAPGAEYNYSNIGAALAAYLVEVTSKQSFDAFTQQHVFQPLGMRSTSWKVDAADAKRLARNYNGKRQAYPHYALITYPDGGLSTTTADLSRFLMAMMRGYAGQDGVLSATGFRQLFDKQFKYAGLPANNPKSEPNSGIFWRIRLDGEIGHTGSDPGVTAFMFFDPATGRGRILLTNTEFGGAGEEDDPAVQQQFLDVWKALGRLP